MLLEIVELTKRYGSKTALNRFTASFYPGIYGIIGKNGAGKSTLMNLLTDNLARSSGSIRYDGAEILDLGSEYRGKIGYMPQTPCCYGSFSVRAFLNYIAQLKGIGRKQAAKEVGHVLEVTHLTGNVSKKLEQLSGGMRQRVMLAQALLGDPLILLLDEPTAGLDPAERYAMRSYIHSISKGKIIFIATHVISDIESIADEVVLMKDGRLICKMPPGELIKEALTARNKGEKADSPERQNLKETEATLEDACLYFLQ